MFKTRTYRGIKIRPTWAWSKNYAAYIAEREREFQKDYMLLREHHFNGSTPVETSGQQALVHDS